MSAWRCAVIRPSQPSAPANASMLAATEIELSKVKAMVDGERGRLRNADAGKIGERAGKVSNKYKMAKHYKLEIAAGSFSYERKTEQIKAEACLDGGRDGVPHAYWAHTRWSRVPAATAARGCRRSASGALRCTSLSSWRSERLVRMPETLLARLSFDAAVRALDLQERSVEQIRGRAGILLATSSVTASFLGAQTIQRTAGLGTLGTLALISLVVSIGLFVYVLLPKEGFVFGLSGPKTYESLFEFQGEEEEVRRRLIYWLETFWQSNQTKIDALSRYFAAAALALMLQLVFWAVALGSTI